MTSLTRPRPVWLLALTLAAFAVQTDDYIIIGVLPAVSNTVHLSETATGQLVTVYSLTYALAAPLWALLPVRIARKRRAMRSAHDVQRREFRRPAHRHVSDAHGTA